MQSNNWQLAVARFSRRLGLRGDSASVLQIETRRGDEEIGEPS